MLLLHLRLHLKLLETTGASAETLHLGGGVVRIQVMRLLVLEGLLWERDGARTTVTKMERLRADTHTHRIHSVHGVHIAAVGQR